MAQLLLPESYAEHLSQSLIRLIQSSRQSTPHRGRLYSHKVNAMSGSDIRIARDHIDAVLFDLDGVVTRTADLHIAAWNRISSWRRHASSAPHRREPL